MQSDDDLFQLLIKLLNLMNLQTKFNQKIDDRLKLLEKELINENL